MNPSPNQTSGPAQNTEVVIDFRHLIRILWRHKLGILSLGLMSAVLAALIVVVQDDIYRSTATLLIQADQANVTSIEQVYGIDSKQQEYYTTQHEMLKNRILAEKVITEFNLLQNPEFAPAEYLDVSQSFVQPGAQPGTQIGTQANYQLGTQVSAEAATQLSGPIAYNASSSEVPAEEFLLEEVIASFNERLSIAPVRNTQLVKISFESRDRRLAANIANSLASAYIEDNMEQRLSASKTANVWLTERMDVLRQSLEESELRLQNFLQQEQLIDIEGVTSLNAQELDELTSQLIEARRRSAEAEAVFRQIQLVRGSSADELMTIPAILNHPSIQNLRDEADAVDRDIAEFSKRYGRNHPRMIALASQQSAVNINLQRQLQQVLTSIENEYLAATDNEQSTQARLEQSKDAIQGITSNNFALQELQREVDTNRQLYDLFFTRARETNETDSFQNTNAVIVDPAVPAIYNVKPKRKLIVIVAAMAGVLLGIMLTLLREMLDNTVKIPADVEDKLNTVVLGLAPLANKGGFLSGKKTEAFLGFNENKHSRFAEALRTIRTSITLSSIDKPHKVIEVTSSVTNEGKTTIAINLAVAMGQVGRTLLIDADLRRPSVAKSIGMASGIPGLSNLIADGTETEHNYIHFWKEGEIDVLPAGQFLSNPLEMISSKRFEKVLDELKKKYDTIIIDTPPINAVSDSLVIGAKADAVAYIIKADSTPINAIKVGMARLHSSNANLIGVVLNQVNTKKQSYYSETDYYGGYYDAHGYGTSGN